ncbi:hypothetical protein AGMMS50249_8120 [candidate division SR1 bacterium]|nr:hypothetical protein AGMMS50249_8120 [candidate division SR1 bacterium]
MKHPCRGGLAGPSAGRMERRRLPLFLHPPGLVLACLIQAGFLCAAPAFGQTAESSPALSGSVRRITPDEAVDLAIKNNLSLESSRVTLDTKKRKSDLVWNQFLPEIDVRGTLAVTAKENKGTPLPLGPGGSTIYMGGQPQWTFSGNGAVSWNFSFALIEGIRSIKLDYQTGLLTYAKARAQMERDIRKSYYQMLLLQENISLLRESFDAAERQVAMTQANYNNGTAPQLSLLQAQVNRDNLKPTIDQAENGLKLAMASFAMNLGLDYDIQFELVPVTGDLNYISLDVKELINKAANGKPDILELRQQALTLTSQRKAQALQARTPYLRLDFGYSPAFLGLWDSMDDTDKWNGHDNATFSITLGLNLNSLFPFTKQGQGLKDFDNNIKTASIGLAQMIRGTEIEIYNTVLSLQRTQITAETQAQTVALADQSYRLTQEAYRGGLQEFLLVQQADISRRQARVQMLEQQFNYLTGLIDLEYSIGVPFGTLSNGGTKGKKFSTQAPPQWC